ncbi:hypothetical protein PVAG01_08834 [Phlyctema vagabunda]|uniref:Uncharacterized protein n=1 Tax=Phlyctema vagabunda TaxID=108571 RepID=A0ABR4PAM7_9HELO
MPHQQPPVANQLPPTPPLSDTENDAESQIPLQSPPQNETSNHVISGLVRVTGKGSLTAGMAGSLSQIALGPMGGLLGGLVGVIYGSVMAGTEGIRADYQPDGWGGEMSVPVVGGMPEKKTERKFGLQNRGFPHGLPKQKSVRGPSSNQKPGEQPRNSDVGKNKSKNKDNIKNTQSQRQRDKRGQEPDSLGILVPQTSSGTTRKNQKRISSSPGPRPERVISERRRIDN